MAAARLSLETPGQMLQPTALVHEAYLRLVDAEQTQLWPRAFLRCRRGGHAADPGRSGPSQDGGQTRRGPGARRARRGLPYFVMELVRGLPITKYCDQAKLTPQQRLELFATVCQAVQHAPQKGTSTAI